jgi:hypothetical protein
MWPINYTDEYEQWFTEQNEDDKVAITAKVRLIAEFGHQLGRPYADVLHGSKYVNLKELRIHHKDSVIRIAFCFDKRRECWLLIGGDKKGKNEEDFYKNLIKLAEDLIDSYHLFDSEEL